MALTQTETPSHTATSEWLRQVATTTRKSAREAGGDRQKEIDTEGNERTEGEGYLGS